MTGAMLPGETVTVLTAAARTDPYSQQPVYDDWANATSVTVGDVLCEPRPSGEPVQDARNSVTTGFTLYFQTVPTVLPDAQNRITVRGIDYEVDGDAADWRLGDWRPGLVVQTKRIEG